MQEALSRPMLLLTPQLRPSKTTAGNLKAKRPQPRILQAGPAACQGPEPENVPEESFIAKT